MRIIYDITTINNMYKRCTECCITGTLFLWHVEVKIAKMKMLHSEKSPCMWPMESSPRPTACK